MPESSLMVFEKIPSGSFHGNKGNMADIPLVTDLSEFPKLAPMATRRAEKNQQEGSIVESQPGGGKQEGGERTWKSQMQSPLRELLDML